MVKLRFCVVFLYVTCNTIRNRHGLIFFLSAKDPFDFSMDPDETFTQEKL